MLFPNFIDFLLKKSYLEGNKDLAQIDRNLEKYLKFNLESFMFRMSNRSHSRESRGHAQSELNRTGSMSRQPSRKSRDSGGVSQRAEVSAKSSKTKKSNAFQNNFLETEAKSKLDEMVAKKSKKESPFLQSDEELQAPGEQERDAVLLKDFNDILFTKELFGEEAFLGYLKENAFDFELSSVYFFDRFKYLEQLRKKRLNADLVLSLANRRDDASSEINLPSSGVLEREEEQGRKRGLSHNILGIDSRKRDSLFEHRHDDSVNISRYFSHEIQNIVRSSNKNRNLLYDLKINFADMESRFGNDVGRLTREVPLRPVPPVHARSQLRVSLRKGPARGDSQDLVSALVARPVPLFGGEPGHARLGGLRYAAQDPGQVPIGSFLGEGLANGAEGESMGVVQVDQADAAEGRGDWAGGVQKASGKGLAVRDHFKRNGRQKEAEMGQKNLFHFGSGAVLGAEAAGVHRQFGGSENVFDDHR